MRSAPSNRNGVLRVAQSGIIPEAGALFPSIRSLGLNGLDLGRTVLQVRELGDGHDVGKDRPQLPELDRLGFATISPDYSHPFIQPAFDLSSAHRHITNVFGAHTAPFPVDDFALL